MPGPIRGSAAAAGPPIRPSRPVRCAIAFAGPAIPCAVPAGSVTAFSYSIRLRAERADHVWSYDFVHHRTYDGRAFRMLNVLDEFARESLAIRVRRKVSSVDVIDVLTDLFILRGIAAWIRSDNGPEFVAEAVRRWVAAVGARTAFIEPGSPWENGYIESFNARLRDELLNGEIFYTLKEAQVLIESWRRHYNAARPHSSLGYRPPAPETIIPPSWPPGSATLRRPSSLAEKPAMH